MRNRYQHLGNEQHGGRAVVALRDSVDDVIVRVYKRGRSWLYWRDDEPVRSAALKRVASEALKEFAA